MEERPEKREARLCKGLFVRVTAKMMTVILESETIVQKLISGGKGSSPRGLPVTAGGRTANRCGLMACVSREQGSFREGEEIGRHLPFQL